jgi:hypothetical protein
MEIKPATLDQIVKGRDGKRHVITNDVGNIAQQLKDIDSTFELHFNEKTEYFVVLQKIGNEEHMVTTAQELDVRILDRIREVINPNYNYEQESIKIQKESEKEAEHKRKEQVGEIGERLAHAMRTDLNEKKNF